MPSLFCFSETKALILISRCLFTGTLLLCKKRYYVWKQLNEAFVLGCFPLNLRRLDWLLSQWSPSVPVLDSLSSQAHALSRTYSHSALLARECLFWFLLTLVRVHPSSMQSVHHAEHLRDVLGEECMTFNYKLNWPIFFLTRHQNSYVCAK